MSTDNQEGEGSMRSLLTEENTTVADGPLVEVEGLEKYFYERDGLVDRLLGHEPVAVRAVDGISFEIKQGETLGLVGESGCGKSTTGETLLRLQEPTAGSVQFGDLSVFDAGKSELQEFRRRAQIVFQDPYTSLDPRITIGETVRESLDIHNIGTKTERNERVRDLLERVGLSEDQFDRYPTEFSGGQRQRVGIARALAIEPEFLVLDEPTSALDVSVQAQILNLLGDLQDELDLTYLLISHDLSVIRHICDRVAVMYLGEIVEIADVDSLFESPQHPYTQALLESVPRADTSEKDRAVEPLAGDVPSPRSPPSGCRFRTRCPEVIPPASLSIDQKTYREIQFLRDRIESRDLAIEGIAEEAGLNPDAIGEYDTRATEAFADELRDRILDVPLPESHQQIVDDAATALASGEWETAAQLLGDEYESICERESPALGVEPTAACHLHGNEVDHVEWEQ